MSLPTNTAPSRSTLYAGLGGVAVTIFLLLLTWARLMGQQENVLNNDTELMGNRLISSLTASAQGAQDLALLFQASEQVDADEFEIFSNAILQRHPHLTFAGYLPLVEAGGRGAFERRMREAGVVGFRIKQPGGGASDGSALPIVNVAPFTVRNTMLLGLDLAALPSLQGAIRAAVEEGHAVFAKVQERRLPPILLFQAVYSGRYTPTAEAERRARVNGLIVLGIQPDMLMPHPASGLTVDLLYRPPSGDAAAPIHHFGDATPTQGTPLTLAHHRNLSIRDFDFQVSVTKRIDITRLSWENLLLALLSGALLSVLVVRRALSHQRQADELRRRNLEIEREVARQTGMLRQVLATIPSRVFWKDRDGQYLGCNPLFARDAGFTDPAEIVGKNDFDMPWKPQAELYRADDRAVVESGEAKLNFEEPQSGADGREFWLETSKIPLLDERGEVIGLLGAYQEITERKLAEQRMKASHDFLRLLLDTIPNPIFYKDLDLVYRGANRALLEFTGKREDEVIGHTLEEVWPSEIADAYETRDRELLAAGVGAVQAYEYGMPHADGSKRDVLFNKAVYSDEQGRPAGIIAVISDITERKRTERERERAREAAEEANRSKSLFLANMSHEIRTPMNAVINLSRLALDSGLQPKQGEYIRKVVHAGEGLLGIINDILDFSKIEAGKLEVERIPFSLQSLLGDIGDVVFHQAEEKSLTARLDTPGDLHDRFIGDPMRLRQVLTNLLNNAVKFTDRGEVVLTVRPVAGGYQRVALTFEVSDSGIGMSEEQIQRLFEPFHQADGSITRRYGGTGLGLTICQRLLALMGSELKVESTPGEGSRFHFTLELEPAEPAAADKRREPAESNKRAPASIDGAHVLLVEDNEVNKLVANALLTAVGLEVEFAENGAEALGLLERWGPGHFDLVLMDLQMPVMDGFEATRRIRAMEPFAELPIVAMTAHALVEERDECLAAGMDDHVAKPIDVEELHAALYRWIAPRDDAPAEAAAVADDELPALPGIDTAEGLARVAGSRPLYEKLLVRLVDEHRNDPRRIRVDLEQGRRDEALRRLHTLKGAAGNLGATALNQAAARLERALRDDDNDESDEAWREFEERFAEVLEGVDAHITTALAARGESPAAADDGGAPDAERIAPLLRELEELVENDLGEARERFAILQPLLTPTALRIEGELLGDALADYDIDGALASIQRIDEALNGNVDGSADEGESE